MVRAFIVLTLAVTFYFALEAKAEECDTIFNGCNIEGQQCECSKVKACTNPWQFRGRKMCLEALFGDPCKERPCQNGGACVQHKEGHAECKCAGTGFFGDSCEIRCPATEENKIMSALPDNACIIP